MLNQTISWPSEAIAHHGHTRRKPYHRFPALVYTYFACAFLHASFMFRCTDLNLRPITNRTLHLLIVINRYPLCCVTPRILLEDFLSSARRHVYLPLWMGSIDLSLDPFSPSLGHPPPLKFHKLSLHPRPPDIHQENVTVPRNTQACYDNWGRTLKGSEVFHLRRSIHRSPTRFKLIFKALFHPQALAALLHASNEKYCKICIGLNPLGGFSETVWLETCKKKVWGGSVGGYVQYW